MGNDLPAIQQKKYFRLLIVNLFALFLVSAFIAGIQTPGWAHGRLANNTLPPSYHLQPSINHIEADIPAFDLNVDEIIASGFTVSVLVTHAGDESTAPICGRAGWPDQDYPQWCRAARYISRYQRKNIFWR